MTGPTLDQLDALAVKLADEGKLIEAGWVAMRRSCMPADAPEVQVRAMRMAFMAGAQHLFASVMAVLDPGDEPSVADLKRMSLISAELSSFERVLREWAGMPPSTEEPKS
jgi:hypothetical protein